ncbi:MinD/ParA family ATP-binding protein [Pseudoclavibacter sp. 8L]|uniref:MinD/ParA family ATP-binding protein n=1 Tax=Pseudoclavibacter sp. 8L TaxID=2653162 RepID=UPI0012F222EE|nr:P-loop NTPase [Pseudoclavibacter sp. 8L]VXB11683.1 Septum formation inhibitor-activating ATPase [Pseudoclavibacter sp. 8L]
MARILMAIDFEIEARLLEGIIAAGHDIVDRVSGGLAAATAVERLRPEIVLLQGAPETLTARSLAACTRFGARFIVVVASDLERRNAETLSAREIVEAAASWSEIEMVIGSAPDAVGDVATGPIPQQSPSFARPPAAASRTVDAGPVGASHDSENAPVLEGSRSATRRAGRARAHAATGATRAPGAAEAPRPVRRRDQGGRGDLLAVWGSHGAPGASTVAAAVAASAAAAGRRVLLIDADSYGGSLAAMLGITDEAPGFAAACRLAGAARLTLAELQRIAAPYAVGRDELLVLTGIANPARWPELSRERVLTVLERCREIADLVVVDVGFSLESDDEIASDAFSPRRSAATLTALGAADRILAVADGQAVGLQRFLRARVNLIEIVGETPVDVIVNRVRGEAVGLGAAGQIKHVLSRFAGLQASALIPLDQSACDRAFLSGEPVTYASPRSGFARAISSYVADTLLAEAETDATAAAGVHPGKRTAGSAPFRRFWRGRGELQGQNS